MKLNRPLAALVVAATVAVGVAGCGGDKDTPSTGAEAARDAGGVFASAPSPALVAPSVIQKKVGERGGAECPPGGTCMVDFTVTELKAVPLSACSRGADIPAGSRVVRVGLDVQANRATPPPNSHIPPGSVVTSQYWYGLGSDGYTTKAETAIGCGDYEPGPFYEDAQPGEKMRGTILFAIPKNSTKLVLRNAAGRGSWEWTLPPVPAAG